MPVQYNMKPFAILKIIYGDATDGFEKNEFEVNENERGIIMPYLLKEFLAKYAYLPVNRQSGSVRFFHPNLMTIMHFSAEEFGDLALLCVGRVGEYQIAVKNEASEDPRVFLIHLGTQAETQVLPSDDVISELIKVMLCNVLMGIKSVFIAEEPEDAVRLLRENGVDLEKIECDPLLKREYTFCYSEETRTFVIAEFVQGNLARFFFVRNEAFN